MPDVSESNLRITDLAMRQMIVMCHHFWCCFMLGAGQPFNEKITEHQYKSLADGILFYIRHGSIPTGEELWQNWKRFKAMSGWVYGPEKDEEKKTHPNIVDNYLDLPEVERRKDDLSIMSWKKAVEIVMGVEKQ
jgi:hypothetical protein